MKIQSISYERYQGLIHNFHCMPNENYIANNVLVHNCYKGNNRKGHMHHMTLDEFKTILDKMPPTLTQIAFGICDLNGPNANPDFMAMMEYSMNKGVIPNFTCNGLGVTPELAAEVSKMCGAVAVSIVNKEKSYDAIKMFTDAGMDQVNIHYVLSEQTYDRALTIVDDMASDSRLSKMRAIVFLQYKHKNPDAKFTSMLDKNKYRKLVDHCQTKQIAYGFDSCSANLFLESMKGHPDEKMFEMVSDPCESLCMSMYINCHGVVSPCSFCENMKFKDQDWSEGLSMFTIEKFQDIWMHPKIQKFRNDIIANGRNCLVYDI